MYVTESMCHLAPFRHCGTPRTATHALRPIRALLSLLIFCTVGLHLGTAAQEAQSQQIPGINYTILHSFGAHAQDGNTLYGSVVQGSNGDFYGTTYYGGTSNLGTIYRIAHDGTTTTLHSFAGSDGANPEAPLIQGSDGSLYGTCPHGGANNLGAIFKITQDGTFALLFSLDSTIGGLHRYWGPGLYGGLLQANDGSLIGVTSYGGTDGKGTVFRLTADGVFTVLHSFSDSDGASAESPPVQSRDGSLYGATPVGGSYGSGVLYRLTLDGTFTVLHSFAYNEGAYPINSPIEARDGSLYGTTTGGGNGYGAVYRLDPNGVFVTLHAFNNSDGNRPQSALLQASDGSFYGTTIFGGPATTQGLYGTLYRMTSDGTVTTLHSFNGSQDGSYPSVFGGLVQGADGKLYGTTIWGGISGSGTVYRLDGVIVPDTSAPVTVASVAGRAGNGGWYTGATTVTLSASDPDDTSVASDVAATSYSVDGGTTQTYSAPFTVSGDGVHMVSFWSRDKAGNEENPHGSIAVKIDSTPPVTTASPDDLSWHNQNVSLTLTSSDGTGSGIAQIRYSTDGGTTWLAYSGSVSVTAEGVNVIRYHATDVAGNVEADKTVTVKLDKTPPSIQTTDVSVTATSAGATVVTFPTPPASDTGSGVVGSVACTPASGTAFPLGTSTVTATASDVAGNVGTATFHVNVTYSWSGILPPVRSDGSSVFKQGRTIPVKFQLTGASAGIINATATLSYVQIGAVGGVVNEATSTSAADTGNQFRYDGSQYIFNMSTSAMTAGAKYKLIIDLHDGVSRTVVISLR